MHDFKITCRLFPCHFLKFASKVTKSIDPNTKIYAFKVSCINIRQEIFLCVTRFKKDPAQAPAYPKKMA
jgi:hypothetical protein